MQPIACVTGRKWRWCRTGTVIGRDKSHGKGPAEEASEADPDWGVLYDGQDSDAKWHPPLTQKRSPDCRWIQQLTGHATAEVDIRRTPTAEGRVQPRPVQVRFIDDEVTIGTNLPPTTLCFPRQYYSTNAPYSLTHSSPSSSRRWTSFRWKFWPSQRPVSISLPWTQAIQFWIFNRQMCCLMSNSSPVLLNLMEQFDSTHRKLNDYLAI